MRKDCWFDGLTRAASLAQLANCLMVASMFAADAVSW